MLVQGTVSKIYKNEKGKFGPTYSIRIGEQWYGVGKDQPKFDEGVDVKFEATTNARGYHDLAKGSSVTVLPRGAPEIAPTTPLVAGVTSALPSAGATKSGTSGGYLPEREKQLTIARQAARNASIAFLNVCAASDTLPVSKTSKTKFEAMIALCDQLTEDFFNYSQVGKNTKESGSEVPAGSVISAAEKAAGDDAGW